MVDIKKWYHSRTLWLNTLIAVGVLIQAITGMNWLDAQLQGAIIVIANVILRLVTKQGLTR
jgi:hypothetical protein|tara:strand:+ start:797 stop:979 length:183 start_codon:yes stop_codon:yes gene_type:complete